MKRRQMLAAVGATTAGGLAGCTEGTLGSSDGDPPITNQEIKQITPRRDRRKKHVRVQWDEAANAVHVVGVMAYGSPECDRPGISNTKYDPQNGELFVQLKPVTREDRPDECSALLDVSGYRATFQFTDSLPDSVRVESENTASGGHQPQAGETAQRTVKRAAQESLCAGERPEDSEQAMKAHWTCPETYLRVPDQ